MEEKKIRVLDIIRGTTVDGPGFRTAIYLAGCRHECPGCQNPESWEFEQGEAMTGEALREIIEEEDFDVTLSGGDPLYSPEAVRTIARITHSLGHTLWVYTGYTWEEIQKDGELLSLMEEIDVLVDGRFVETLKDPDLRFRGSSNQRLIDVKETLKAGEIRLTGGKER